MGTLGDQDPGMGKGVSGGPGDGGAPGAQHPPQLRAQEATTVWQSPLVAITPHLENLSRHRSAAGERESAGNGGKTARIPLGCHSAKGGFSPFYDAVDLLGCWDGPTRITMGKRGSGCG